MKKTLVGSSVYSFFVEYRAIFSIIVDPEKKERAACSTQREPSHQQDTNQPKEVHRGTRAPFPSQDIGIL